HFPSVVEAVQAALKIQETLLTSDEEVAEDLRLRLRVGIHLGDILIEGADIYGDGVNVAARLESLTPPGGLCISDGAYDQLDGKTSALFEDF
nr:adenylate/guanylate cyclase domain-containing protein [Desulfuromonadales bacterium]